MIDTFLYTNYNTGLLLQPLAPFAKFFSVNKKLCAVYNNTIYSYTNTARFVRTNVFVDHYWHIQWKYTNYVYVVIFSFIMLLIIREFQCQWSHVCVVMLIMPTAQADGDADGYKLSLRLTPIIYVAIVLCI